MENEIDILDENKMENITNEIFYDELIKALKSDEKVFNLKDVSIKGDIRIDEIYERIKNDDELKHSILSEENRTIIYIDVDIGMEDVVFENDVDFWQEGDNNICVKFKNVEFRYCIFEGNINFIGSTFKGDAGFWNLTFKGNTEFGGLTFEEEASFRESTFERRINFNELIFKKNVDFIGSTFKGDAYFGKSIFEKNAYFMNSTFEGEANFRESTFEEGANFDKLIFKGNVDFIGSTFKGYANFMNSVFKGNANFMDSAFKGNADFSKSIFKGNIEFDKLIFKGNVNFVGSTFKGYAGFWNLTFEGNTEFRGSTFEERANFNKSTFKGEANFMNSTFEGNIEFGGSTFEERANFIKLILKGEANFNESTFEKETNFNELIFKENANFDKVIFNNAHFSHSIFNAVASFLDISYKLLSFKECTFESTTYFKNKEKEKQMPAFFNLINFKSANSTIFTNFSLSTTSFILTDVKNIVMILGTSKNEKIFDEMLLEITPKEKLEEIELKKKLKENMKKNISDEKILSDDFIEKVIDISPYLRHETVLKEYRDIRKSFEKHRTYSEASNLFIREMDLIKKNSNMPKKIIFTLYKLISKYGESIWLPLGWSIFFIILLPIIAISFAYSINHVPILYLDTLGQVLRAFFQLKMFPPENVSFITQWEWFIRVVSLILLTNIALTLVKQLKRR